MRAHLPRLMNNVKKIKEDVKHEKKGRKRAQYLIRLNIEESIKMGKDIELLQKQVSTIFDKLNKLRQLGR